MRRFWINLAGDGLKGHKRTENEIEFFPANDDFSNRIKRLKSNHHVLAKQYSADTDIFEEEKKFRKVINGGTHVDWVLLDDNSYLAVKFTVKGNNKVNEWFMNYGFEEMEL